MTFGRSFYHSILAFAVTMTIVPIGSIGSASTLSAPKSRASVSNQMKVVYLLEGANVAPRIKARVTEL
jgi:hypothetical protein